MLAQSPVFNAGAVQAANHTWYHSCTVESAGPVDWHGFGGGSTGVASLDTCTCSHHCFCSLPGNPASSLSYFTICFLFVQVN